MTHELCEIVAEKGMTKLESWLDGFLYNHFKRYKILDERNTDLMVIQRGYRKQLLAFLEYTSQQGYPRYQEDGQ